MVTKKKDMEEAAAPISFDWAQNPRKLAQAVEHVRTTTNLVSGTKEHHDAVKERYVQIKGLVHGASKNRTGKGGARVVNVADDDGSEEIENDETDDEE